jgi:hypothetical protein
MRRRVLSMDFLITVAFAAVALVAILQAREWPFRAGLFPLVTASVLLFVSLIKIGADLLARQPAPHAATPTRIQDEEEDAEAELVDVFATARPQEWLSAIVWMGAFFLSLWVFGALVAVPLFAVVYLLLVSRASPTVTAAYAFVAWLFVYGLFIRLLHIPLPVGVVWGA